MDRRSKRNLAACVLSLGLGLGCGGSSTSGSSSGSAGSTTGGTTTGTGGTSGGGQDAGLTVCDPLAATNICTPLGLVCDSAQPLADGGALFACRLPREQETCLPTVGCDDPGTVCDTFQPAYSAGGGPVVTFCARLCDPTKGSTDCPIFKTTCRSDQSQSHGVIDVCRTTRCGPTVVPTNGTGFFAACDAAAAGDGYCLPFAADVGDTGICFQTGPALPTGPCSFSRQGGTTADLCPADTFCVPSIQGGASATCLPVCAPHPISGNAANPMCPAADICLTFELQADFGTCVLNCSNDPSVCPSGTVCTPTSTPSVKYCAN